MKPRLPAYGRELQHLRDRYHGPEIERVWVIIGRDWSRLPRDNCCVCASPDRPPEYYDWSVLIGLPADVVSRDGAEIEPYAAEIARFAAPVRLHWLLDQPEWPVPAGPVVADIAEVAFCRRILALGGKGWQWPSWWTPVRERIYSKRRHVWMVSRAAEALGPHG